MSDAVIPSIIGDNVVLARDGGTVTVPFGEWNDLIERIGYRTPAEDKHCPPDDYELEAGGGCNHPDSPACKAGRKR